jgi:hypothetical protein
LGSELKSLQWRVECAPTGAGRFKAVPMQFPANPLTLASAVDPDDAGVVLPNAVLTQFLPAGEGLAFEAQ